jgi:hypothetical protein
VTFEPEFDRGGVFSSGAAVNPNLLPNNLLISVTSWGGSNCQALDQIQRIDVPGVRSFINRNVDLP